MTGARDPAADLECRLGPRYDGGRRSCLRIALYTYGDKMKVCTDELNARNLPVQWPPFQSEFRRIFRIHPGTVSGRHFL